MQDLFVVQTQAADPVRTIDAKAVLLVGGLGTRLRTVVPSTPKAMAPIGDRPFLELLIRQLESQGIRDVLLCTGYLADQIESSLGDGSDFGVAIEYSKEPQPLGTGGALKFAERLLRGIPDFVVMNGDSFVELDLRQLLQFHHTHGGVATMAVVCVEDAGRYGTVHMDSDNRITEFMEKTGANTPGLINAGVYIFSSTILEYIPDGPLSLEKEVFPRLLDRGVYAVREQGVFIDIGTPADYAKAQQLFDPLRRATTPTSRS